jgi:hypothetical protein
MSQRTPLHVRENCSYTYRALMAACAVDPGAFADLCFMCVNRLPRHAE